MAKEDQLRMIGKKENGMVVENRNVVWVSALVLMIASLFCLGCGGRGRDTDPVGVFSAQPQGPIGSSRWLAQSTGSSEVIFHETTPLMNSLALQIVVHGAPPDFRPEAILVDDQEREIRFPILAMNAESVTLAAQSLSIRGIPGFSMLKFTQPVPEGCWIEVIDKDVASPMLSSIRASSPIPPYRLDLNGDGRLTSDDVILFLAWYQVTDKNFNTVFQRAKELWKPVKGPPGLLPQVINDDLNNDGNIDSHDAALFVAWYQVKSVVPASTENVLARARELWPEVLGPVGRLPGDLVAQVLTLPQEVSGLNSLNLQINIRSVSPSSPIMAWLPIVIDGLPRLGFWQPSSVVTIPDGIVLMANELQVGSIASFSQIKFNELPPSGARLEIIDRDSGNIILEYDFAPGPRSLATIITSGGQASRPTVSGSKVYTHFDDGFVVCFDALSESVLWTFRGQGSSGDSQFGVTPGCALGDVNGDGVEDVVVPLRGLMTAICGSTRNALWQVSAEGAMSCTPTAVDLNEDGCADAVFGTMNTLYAINGKTGQTMWTKSIQAVYADILAIDVNQDGKKEIIACGTHGDDTIHALKPTDGATMWSTKLAGKIESGPIACDVDNDGNLEIFVGSHEPSIVCLDSRDGTIKWRTNTNIIHARLNVVEQNGTHFLIAPSFGDRLYCLNASTGQSVWDQANAVCSWYWGGIGVIKIQDKQYWIVPDFHRSLINIKDAATGDVKESYSIGSESFSTCSMPVVAAGKIVLPTSGKILILK